MFLAGTGMSPQYVASTLVSHARCDRQLHETEHTVGITLNERLDLYGATVP